MNFNGVVIAGFIVVATASAFMLKKFGFLGVSKSFHIENESSSSEFVTDAIKNNKVVVFSKTYCPYCTNVKKALQKLNVDFHLVELDEMKNGIAVQTELLNQSGQKTVPNVYVNGKHIGGCDNTLAAIRNGELQKLLGI